MKQKFYIILALAFILLLLAIFIYLFVFGTPKTEEVNPVFNDLGMAGQADNSFVLSPEPNLNGETAGNIERPRLRQLTTKPVVGFVEVQATATDPVSILYAEGGTGHIYQIDFLSGVETRISNTTIAEASFASFSPSGNHVAFRSGDRRESDNVRVWQLDRSQGLSGQSIIANQIDEFKIINDRELIFTSRSNEGLVNNVYNLESQVTTKLFTVPFYEAKMLWGSTSRATHYTHPKPSALLEGYLYSFHNGKMSRLPLQGYGFSATANEDMVLYNKVTGQNTVSHLYNLASGESRPLDAVVVPEKCYLPHQGLEFVCGFEATDIPREFPDEWYKGNISFKDSIWLLNAKTMTGESLINTLTESGREVDMIDLQYYPEHTSNSLYFINKNDNTLWLYEL